MIAIILACVLIGFSSMLYATVDGREKVTASPNGRAVCPGCGRPVIAKCGEIVSWHWAHESGCDCDPWYEGETRWHTGWKKFVHPSRAEVVIGCHRADMVGIGGVIVELQHSPIAPQEIAERESFYKNMIWLVDARGFEDNLSIRYRGSYFSFRWRWPRKSWWSAKAPLYWHFGDGQIFQVKKLYRGVPCGGWGEYIQFATFVYDFFGAVRKKNTERP